MLNLYSNLVYTPSTFTRFRIGSDLHPLREPLKFVIFIVAGHVLVIFIIVLHKVSVSNLLNWSRKELFGLLFCRHLLGSSDRQWLLLQGFLQSVNVELNMAC